jgi:uncharacterized repeat protein (TIGR03943 family)
VNLLTDVKPDRSRVARPRRTWNAARLSGAAVLAAWAGLFWFLLVSGRKDLYLSTRTSWVVPTAAIILTVAAIGRITTARTDRGSTPSRREVWVMAILVVPVVVLMSLPPATLGSYSAGKRSGFAGIGITSTSDGSAAVSFLDVGAAQTTPEGGRALAARAGDAVDLVGTVTRYGDTPADEFLLTRYIVTCCVADATVAQVRGVNVPPGEFAQDVWVDVRGPVYPLGREVIVMATSIHPVPRPARPYLTP